MNAVVSEALNIIYRFIMPLCNEQNRSAVERCLLSIAGVSEFNFSGQLMFGSYGEVQAILARINERESIRKSKGVFYTPTDVVRFIVGNSIKASFGALTPENIQSLAIAPELVNSYCFQKTVFEPTCGAGEFLLEALNQSPVCYANESAQTTPQRKLTRFVQKTARKSLPLPEGRTEGMRQRHRANSKTTTANSPDSIIPQKHSSRGAARRTSFNRRLLMILIRANHRQSPIRR